MASSGRIRIEIKCEGGHAAFIPPFLPVKILHIICKRYRGLYGYWERINLERAVITRPFLIRVKTCCGAVFYFG